MIKIVNISKRTLVIQGKVIYPLKSVLFDPEAITPETQARLNSLERSGVIKIYNEEVTKRVVRARKTKIENNED